MASIQSEQREIALREAEAQRQQMRESLLREQKQKEMERLNPWHKTSLKPEAIPLEEIREKERHFLEETREKERLLMAENAQNEKKRLREHPVENLKAFAKNKVDQSMAEIVSRTAKEFGQKERGSAKGDQNTKGKRRPKKTEQPKKDVSEDLLAHYPPANFLPVYPLGNFHNYLPHFAPLPAHPIEFPPSTSGNSAVANSEVKAKGASTGRPQMNKKLRSWCVNSLKELNGSTGCDVTEDLKVLSDCMDVESSDEIKRLILDAFGEDEKTRLFADQFCKQKQFHSQKRRTNVKLVKEVKKEPRKKKEPKKKRKKKIIGMKQ